MSPLSRSSSLAFTPANTISAQASGAPFVFQTEPSEFALDFDAEEMRLRQFATEMAIDLDQLLDAAAGVISERIVPRRDPLLPDEIERLTKDDDEALGG